MFKSSSLQAFGSMPKSPAYTKIQTIGEQLYDVKEPSLKLMITNLMNSNKELTEKLNSEKSKNYDLLQLKRRMQDDISRLEFELQRISDYKTLNLKENQVKKNQILQDNKKLQNQLDQYFEENKKMRSQNRKLMNQIQDLVKEKENIINQNVFLRKTMESMKQQIAQLQLKLKQSEQKCENLEKNEQNIINQRIITTRSKNAIDSQNDYNTLRNLPSIRSANSGTDSYVVNSPIKSPNYYYSNVQSNGDFYRKVDLSTNPSEGKISFVSPGKQKSCFRDHLFTQKVQQDYYQEDAEPTPRSFSNAMIKQNFNFYQAPQKYQQNMDVKANRSDFISIKKQTPIIETLNFNKECTKQNLKMQEKNQLKNQLVSLKNQIFNDLLKCYSEALEKAQKQKNNCFKVFIQKIQLCGYTLGKMVKNYMEAQNLVQESWETFRMKTQHKNPNLPSSDINIGIMNSNSEVVVKNTYQIYKIYQNIKQKGKQQKTIPGQCLALFRYLTILSKPHEISQNLIDCIKHSALKQIIKIQKLKSKQLQSQSSQNYSLNSENTQSLYDNEQ